MPDMTVPPPNQCFADGSAGAEQPPEASVGPPTPPSVQPSADFGGRDGAEGVGTSGSDELVRRFANEGGGGAPGAPGALSQREDSCFPDDLKAIGSCGGSVLAALVTGGAGALFAGLSCAGAALAVVDCHTKDDAVRER